MINFKLKPSDIVKSIRYRQVITGPFPVLTSKLETIDLTRSIFGFKRKTKVETDVSPWEAYRMGYDKAYQEIMAVIDAEIEANNGTD